ncbi:TIGR04282 family arsenosugar biosynthesis glycosyltransferase [Brevibacterium atlanticum]|uniref:TIGR04282 family arsenosugar biosynthesis glycosyltransferase n=1 Tax=Brevibacterium atlanticum TaxID=2697563 RepID=UPI0014215249|nr:DUF2064 domain-containing protein [Brevibacterium atlanticum]
MTTLIMLAKECVPGKVKTRLHPPLSLTQAAEVAAACIDITTTAVDSCTWTRTILCFDGTSLPRDFTGWEIIEQVTGGLDERIAAAFDVCTGPTVLIGMDSPQLDRRVLDRLSAEWPEDCDAWFGPAADGGFWALGLREPDGELVRGVPMSRPDTGAIQLDRLRTAGRRTKLLPTLRDIDTIDDLHAVARLLPWSPLAKLVGSLSESEESAELALDAESRQAS